MATLHKTGGRQRPSQVKIGRGPVERSFSRAAVTYQLQKVNCGKPRCRRCKGGPSHGPYWYAYYWAKGATRSKYVGKQLPADLGDVDQAAELPPLGPLDAAGIHYGCGGQPGGSWRDCGNAATLRLADRGGRAMCASCADKFKRRCRRLQLRPPVFEPFIR